MNDKTITIYNYHKLSKKWIKTVINGVNYRYSTVKTVSQNGAIVMTPTLNVIIPIDADTNGKKYIEYNEFSNISDIGKYWTINPKDNQDVIVCCNCDKEITDGYRVSSLKSDYLKSGVVKSLDDNTEGDLLKHFKVVCQ